MFKIFLIVVLSLTNLYSDDISYTTQIKSTKQNKINQALLLKQYLYDLKTLNEILQKLYNNKSFGFASNTAEMSVKNNSLYSYDYISNLLHILKGYVPYINDLYNDNYKMYLINIPNNLSKNFDYIKNDIDKNLLKLSKNLKDEKNIRPILKQIFYDLILSLNEVNNETIQLKKLNIIKPFNEYIDKKYDLPTNWCQLDGKTTLADILNFILNGDKKYRGIKYYYKVVYQNDTKPLVIVQ